MAELGTAHAQVCPNPIDADIVIMLDRTSTMGGQDRPAEIAAAKIVVDCVGTLAVPDRPLVAVGAYGDKGEPKGAPDAFIAHVLTNLYGDDDFESDGDLYDTIDEITPENSGRMTNIADALTIAQAELDADGIHTRQIIILIGDGDSTDPGNGSEPSQAALDAATDSKAGGTELYTIALNADAAGEDCWPKLRRTLKTTARSLARTTMKTISSSRPVPKTYSPSSK